MDPDTPQFCKARPLLYGTKKLVQDELERLAEEGTLNPVDYAEWAASIAAVLKSDHKSASMW